MKNEYDIIVIGSGPGGEGAAMQAAKAGKHVAVIDDLPVGGNCTHRTTIPSKVLRHAVRQLAEIGKFENANHQNLVKTAESVIRQQVKLRRGFYERNLVDIIQGRAAFVDEHTVEVTKPGALAENYKADAFVIATGSRPYHPEDVDFSHPRILDSDSVLSLQQNTRDRLPFMVQESSAVSMPLFSEHCALKST